jgi:hypothetical protein
MLGQRIGGSIVPVGTRGVSKPRMANGAARVTMAKGRRIGMAGKRRPC